MVFEFNTGREYGPEGQWVFVRYDEGSGVATFADLTRGVDGACAVSPGLSRWQVEGAVLTAYDQGRYESSLETRRFAERCAEFAVGDGYGDTLEEFLCPGHEWSYSGTSYGGDDESYRGEGRCRCALCGKDGDA